MKRNRSILCGIIASLSFILISCAGSNVSSVPPAVSTINTPSFSPSGGTFVAAQYVTITCAVPDVTIRYTTDGSTPSENYGIVYSGNSITVPNTQTIQAIAYKNGYNDSRISSAAFSIASTVANPVFTVSGGSYADSCNVGITCATSGVSIRYTTDGSDPSSTTGTLYTTGGTISITQSTTPVEIKAIAYETGYLDSSISDASYLVTGYVPGPVFTPSSLGGGVYTYPTMFTYTMSLPPTYVNPEVVIRYTTDGSPPSRSIGTMYAPGTQISVSSSVNVQAFAYVPSWSSTSDSPVVTQDYAVDGYVSAPAILPTGTLQDNCYLNTVSIAMSCSFPGSSILYTIDDSNMADASPYTQVIVYTSTPEVPVIQHTLRAYAVASGYIDSTVTTLSFTVTGTVADPVFSLVSGNYTDATTVSLTSATPNAEIFYTTDGTDPTSSTNVQLYSGSIQLSSTAPNDIRAYATLTGWQSSNVVENVYTITGMVPTIKISPDTTTFDNPMTVSLSLSDTTFTNPNVLIVYTTDGTPPSRTNGITYTGPFCVGATSPCTVSAMAYIPSWQGTSDSAVTQKIYTVNRTIYCIGTLTSGTSSYGYVWENGAFIELLPPSGAVNSFTSAICDGGSFVYVSGGYLDSNYILHAYAWRIDPSNNNSVIGISLTPPNDLTDTSPTHGQDVGGSGTCNITLTSQGVYVTGYFTESKVSGYTVTTDAFGTITSTTTNYAYFKFPCYWSSAGTGYLPAYFVVDATPYSYPDTFPLTNQAVCTAIGYSGGIGTAGAYAPSDASTPAVTWLGDPRSLSQGEYTKDIIVSGGNKWYCGYKETNSTSSRTAYFWGSPSGLLPLNGSEASPDDSMVAKARNINGTVYCAGHRKLSTNVYQACYWSGSSLSTSSMFLTDLPASTGGDSMSVDIGAYTTYIYAVGYIVQSSVQTPTLWINGTAQTIQPPSSDETFSIAGMIIR